MEYRIIPAHGRQVAAWPGGTTEQLYIWPEAADYSARDFAFRISTATVDLPRSDFTPLPGFVRWIMPLSGHLALTHQGHGGAQLGPLEAHRFDGGWATASAGQCTDFNLMLAAGWDGLLAATPGEHPCPSDGFVGAYAFGGPVTATLRPPEGGQMQLTLACGDLLVARGPVALALPEGRAAVFAAFPGAP